MVDALVEGCAKPKGRYQALWDDNFNLISSLSDIQKFAVMNGHIYLILFVFVVLTACGGKESSLPVGDSQPKVESDQAKSATRDLPDLPLTMRDGTKKSASEISGNVALILFQPDCDHCQREAEDIRRNIDGFKDFELYFISSAPIEEVIQFARQYDLEESKQVHLGTTTVPDILRSFGPIDAPSIYLYGEDGKLIQSFNGEVAIEVVLKYI